VQQLLRLGVEQLVLLPFDRELAALSPQSLLKDLVQQLRSQQISVGGIFALAGSAVELPVIYKRSLAASAFRHNCSSTHL